jgi:hypothetical protein
MLRKYIQRELLSVFPIEPDVLKNCPEWLKNLDWNYLVAERQKGVSFKILFQEIPNLEVKYWCFWRNLKELCNLIHPKKPNTTMLLRHKPGEKCFIDYGDGILIRDQKTGAERKTWIFVATMPFSSKVFAEFVFDQKLPSFINSHENCWNFFGGVPPYVVSDNLKSAVTRAHIYDPDINKTYCNYANHAGFAVLPARPRRPKDKANVECHVGILQRSFFQKVRNEIFFSIGELNYALKNYLKELNDSVMKDHGVSRNQRFETEQKVLQPLPLEQFEMPEWKESVVHPDCHIQVAKSFYSVPWIYVGKHVRVKVTNKNIEVFDLRSLERIAFHTKCLILGGRKTQEEHWPPEQYSQTNFTVEYAKKEAAKIGKHTEIYVNALFEQQRPLQHLRKVQGLLRHVSSHRFSKEAMEYATAKAFGFQKTSNSYLTECCAYFTKSNGKIDPKKFLKPERNSENTYCSKIN